VDVVGLGDAEDAGDDVDAESAARAAAFHADRVSDLARQDLGAGARVAAVQRDRGYPLLRLSVTVDDRLADESSVAVLGDDEAGFVVPAYAAIRRDRGGVLRRRGFAAVARRGPTVDGRRGSCLVALARSAAHRTHPQLVQNAT
jgi:hypothetical protein